MAVSRRQAREGHLVGTADLGLDLVDLAREAVRRQPFGHRVGIEERSVDPLRWCTKYPVKLDGVLSHCSFLLVVAYGGRRDTDGRSFYDGDERAELRSTSLVVLFCHRPGRGGCAIYHGPGDASRSILAPTGASVTPSCPSTGPSPRSDSHFSSVQE